VVVSDRGALAEGIEDGCNGFVIDTSNGQGLANVLHAPDSNVERFKPPPPGEVEPMRRAADQGRDIALLYRAIAKKTCFGASTGTAADTPGKGKPIWHGNRSHVPMHNEISASGWDARRIQLRDEGRSPRSICPRSRARSSSEISGKQRPIV